jgi:hypothetical protein
MLPLSALQADTLSDIARVLLVYASFMGAGGRRGLSRRLILRAAQVIEHRGRAQRALS